MNNLENICTTFFYWWYNQTGTNTATAMDIQDMLTIIGGIVTLTCISYGIYLTRLVNRRKGIKKFLLDFETEQGFRDWCNKTEEGKEAMTYINELKEKAKKWDELNQTHTKEK